MTRLTLTVRRGDRVTIGEVELVVERVGGELTVRTGATTFRLGAIEKRVGQSWVSAHRKGGRHKLRINAPPSVSIVRAPPGGPIRTPKGEEE